MNARAAWGAWGAWALLLLGCGAPSPVTPSDRSAFQALHARLVANGATQVSRDRVADAEAEAARAEELADGEEAHEAMALAIATLALADAESEHAAREQERLQAARKEAEATLDRAQAQARKRDQDAAAETSAADRELLRDAVVPTAKEAATPEATRRELLRVLRAEAARTCALAGKPVRSRPPAKVQGPAPNAIAAKDLPREVAEAESSKNACIQALPRPSAPLASALRDALPEPLKALSSRDRRGLVLRGTVAALRGVAVPPDTAVVVAGKQARKAAAALGLTTATAIDDDTLGDAVEIAILAADR